MLAKKTSKNQLTLPKAVIEALPDAEYFDVTVKGGKITLVPVKMAPVSATLEGIREKMGKLGITEKDITDAIKWARKTKR